MSIEKDKMISGKLYDASDPVLSKERTFAKELIRKYNITGKNKTAKRQKMLSKLFQKDLSQIKDSVWIEPPFFLRLRIQYQIKGKILRKSQLHYSGRMSCRVWRQYPDGTERSNLHGDASYVAAGAAVGARTW